MNDDELRALIRAADPASDVDEKRAPSWIQDLVEETVMTHDADEGVAKAGGSARKAPARGRWIAAAAAALVVGGGALAATILATDGGGTGGTGDDAPRKELALTLAPQDAMQMCMAFSPEALRPLEVAFSGTVDDVQGDTVTLSPDHWYAGDTGADVVVVTAGSPEVLLEGGITFAEGERYLVGAFDGAVATCGLSAPWSTEMAAAYDEAF